MDLSSIDKEIERLQSIKSLLSDPRSAAMVKEFLSQNALVLDGHAEAVPARTAKRKKVSKDRGTQARMIRRAVAEQAEAFDVGVIGNAVRERGLEVNNTQVGRALQRMLKKLGTIKLVQPGVGSAPNRYEKTEKFKV